MSEQVYIMAILTVAASHADELEREIQNCIAESRKEEACQRYFLYRDLDKKGRFTANEVWASPASFEEHIASPHFQALAALLQKLNADVEIMKVSPIEPRA